MSVLLGRLRLHRTFAGQKPRLKWLTTGSNYGYCNWSEPRALVPDQLSDNEELFGDSTRGEESKTKPTLRARVLPRRTLSAVIWQGIGARSGSPTNCLHHRLAIPE